MITYKKGTMYFEGKNVENLAERYGTPFFLFSEHALRQNYRDFVKFFSSGYKNIRVDFSVKTDYEKSVLKILNDEGSCAEIVAAFELKLLENIGFSSQRVIFDGPCKVDSELSYCMKMGIHAFYADSLGELVRLDKLAGKMGKKVNVGLRVNLDIKGILNDLAYRYVSKFGVSYDEALEGLINVKNLKHIRIIALSTHMGSQVLAPNSYLKAVDMLTLLAKKLKSAGIFISEINLGGGYPSQTLIKTTLPRLIFSNLGILHEKKPAPLKDFGQKISQRFTQRAKEHNLKNIILAFQPGRSISSNMGIAVTKVWVVKKNWVFVDVSTSSIPESILFAQRRIIPVSKRRGDRKRYNIAGKGLNSVDNFAIGESFPEIKEGDLMVVLDAGAYSISRANRFTTLNPPVYMIREGGTLQMVRRGETFKDVLGPMEF